MRIFLFQPLLDGSIQKFKRKMLRIKEDIDMIYVDATAVLNFCRIKLKVLFFRKKFRLAVLTNLFVSGCSDYRLTIFRKSLSKSPK